MVDFGSVWRSLGPKPIRRPDFGHLQIPADQAQYPATPYTARDLAMVARLPKPGFFDWAIQGSSPGSPGRPGGNCGGMSTHSFCVRNSVAILAQDSALLRAGHAHGVLEHDGRGATPREGPGQIHGGAVVAPAAPEAKPDVDTGAC